MELECEILSTLSAAASLLFARTLGCVLKRA